MSTAAIQQIQFFQTTVVFLLLVVAAQCFVIRELMRKVK